MLQHNVRRSSDRAHLAHATLIAMHALCCGLPAAFAVLAVSGAMSGLSAVSTATGQLHAALHHQEIWILAVSAALVALGGGMEWSARRDGLRRDFPWLFLLTALCFAINLAIVAVHRA